MKYIKSFETEAAFEAGKGDLLLPYVAYTQDDEKVHYARRLEDMYDIVGTLVPGTTSFTFSANAKTITPTIIGDRFVYNWTGGTLSSVGFYSASLLTLDKFEVDLASDISYNNAFNGSSNLKQPFFFNGQTTIGGSEFSNCTGMTGTLTIPNSVTSIGGYAFRNCSGLTGSLTIPDSVNSIGEYAFIDCSGFNGSLTIGNSVTTIGNGAFYRCGGLTGSLTIPDSVTSIGSFAFDGCRGFTGSLTIPDSVTSIGDGAFSGCSGFNGSLTIPDSVTSIGSFAFRRCRGLTGSLTIPNSVATIGERAFYECRSLTSITCIATTPPTLGNNAFDNTNNCPIYVPAASVDTYKAASGWSQLASRIQPIQNS